MAQSSSTMGVVLAAGKGTRMNSNKAKVLHEVFGEPMLVHVLRSLDQAGVNRRVAVVGHQRETVESFLPKSVESVTQDQQKGTGHAVLQVLESLESIPEENVLVACGDIPGIPPEEYDNLCRAHRDSEAECTVLTSRVDDPSGYGRVIVESDHVRQIVEHVDATPEQRDVNLINTGIIMAKTEVLKRHLPELTPENEAGEIYLTDLITRVSENGGTVGHQEARDELEVTGVNTRRDLVEFEREMYRRRAYEALERGVTVHDPERVRIGPWVKLHQDVELRGDVVLEGKCILGEGATVIGSSRIIDAAVGPDTAVERSVLREAVVGKDVQVGPFCHLRPGTEAKDRTRLGNFVEAKNTTIHADANAAHLSYLGDAEVGSGANVGAGTITCNYDGYDKHKTTIGDGAFIGSNTELVAPVTVGEGSMVGAGTTVTRDVPPHSLALSRVDQENREGWVKDVWENRHRKDEDS